MGTDELTFFLEEELSRLLEGLPDLRDVYQTLWESIRTLPIPLRSRFAPDAEIRARLAPEATEIHLSEPEPEEGETQANTRVLADLVNSTGTICNVHLADPASIELEDLHSISAVHAVIRPFLEQLYRQATPLGRQGGAQMAALARQKRKDIETLLERYVEPFFVRLTWIREDQYRLALRRGLEGGASSARAQALLAQPEEALRQRCAEMGLPYREELVREVTAGLEAATEEEFDRLVRGRYAKPQPARLVRRSSLRRRYLRILHRFLARSRDVARLVPILQHVYHLYQPRPSLAVRIGNFFARLAGRHPRVPRRDVEFAYIVAEGGISRRKGSLEETLSRAAHLEKILSRARGHIDSLALDRGLATYPPERLAGTVEEIRLPMKALFDDCFGLVQWLGKKGNSQKLQKIPEGTLREFNAALHSIHATLIINQERLEEVARLSSPPGQWGVE